MNFNEFRHKVITLYSTCGLYDNSNEYAQRRCFLEEKQEFLDSLKTKDINNQKMELADMVVTIINAAQFTNNKYPTPDFKLESLLKWSDHEPIDYVDYQVFNSEYSNALSALKYIADHHNFDFMECCELTWDKIKDRKFIFRDGKAIKWESMTDDERNFYRQTENALIMKGVKNGHI